jgi:prepilin-type N-terminal cleavage/methylation domain-containing protein
MNSYQQRGFTLWELLITLLVAGILLGIGIPNVMEFQRNGAMTAAANQLVTGVLVARTEAVKRQAPVTLCLSDNPTDPNPTCSPNGVADSATRGFIVFVDDNDNFDANGVRILTDGTDRNAVVNAGELVLMQSAAPGGTMRISANCGYVSYLPTGFTRQIPGLCNPAVRAILFCDDRGRRVAAGSLSSARAVRIDQPGRGQVLQETADVNTIITVTLPGSGITPTCP